MLRHFIRAHLFLLVTSLFLTAVALTAARLWVPTVGNYRHDLEAAASRILHRDVTIDRLEATWRGLGPVIKLKHVAVRGAAGGAEQLAIREVWIRLDTRDFISEGKLRPSGIDVIGTSLALTRDADGRIFLEGFRDIAEGNADFGDLLRMRRLSINDSSVTITDHMSGKPAQRFPDVTLALANNDNEHTLSGYVLLPDELGNRIDVEARLYGEDGDFRQWQGRAYVKGRALTVPQNVVGKLSGDLSMHGIADIRLWLDFTLERLQSIGGEVEVRDFMLENRERGVPYRFSADTLQGRFGWRRAGKGWQMALQDLSMMQGEETWEAKNLSLAGATVDGKKHLRLVAGRFRLDGLRELLPVIPGLSAESRRHIFTMQPRGVIHDLNAALEYTDDGVAVSSFSAGFSDLNIRQSDVSPFIDGLAGSVTGTQESGALWLHSRNVSIHDENMFRDALLIESLQGDVDWQLSDGHLELGSGNLKMENRDLDLTAAFGIDIPPGGAAPALNLQLAVEKANVGHVSLYLPAGYMPASGVSWLDRSLVSGVVSGGTVVINGRLDQLPFDNKEGELEVRLPVRDAVLDFNEDWSPITGLAAQVNFSGRSMDIVSHQGTIRTAQLKDVEVRIRDLARPVLTLTGSVTGSLTAMLAELGKSPLGDSYGGFVDRVSTSGDAELDLDLRLPLHGRNTSVKVSGKVKLDDNALSVRDSTIALKKIKGTLFFDDNGIRGKNIVTQMYGKPASVRVWSGAEEGATHISLDGKLGLLRQMVGSNSVLYPSISGNSDWQVVLSIQGMPRRGKKANISLHASSTLAGTAIDLPAPFGKDRDSTRELTFEADGIDYPEKRVRLSYGNLLKGLLVFSSDKQTPELQRGAITFGGREPVLPAGNRLLVSGNLKQIHTGEWKPYLGSSAPGLGLPVIYQLDVEELEVLGYYLDDVSLQMEAAGLVWNIKAGGPSISGEINLTKTGAGFDKVVMDLKHLVLKSAVGKTPLDEDTLLPTDFPNLQIVAKRFVYNGIDLGNCQLATERQPDHTLKLTRLLLSSRLLEARIKGTWRMQDGRQRSDIDVEVTRGEMEELMKVFGYQQSIKDGNLSGTMRAAWAGPPWEFSPASIEGKINLTIKKGQLVDLEPGAAGRVLGLLSLSNLPRRLMLDFRDLFGDGFSFDRISGSFVIEDGDAYTTDLTVKGPSARIEVSGRVGLAARDYDQLVTVTPRMKTPFSLAGTLVGGPAVGAAIMVAETLLEGRIKALNKIVRTQYTLTGPWSDPKIEKITTSETGQPSAPEKETEKEGN